MLWELLSLQLAGHSLFWFAGFILCMRTWSLAKTQGGPNADTWGTSSEQLSPSLELCPQTAFAFISLHTDFQLLSSIRCHSLFGFYLSLSMLWRWPVAQGLKRVVFQKHASLVSWLFISGG